MINSLILKVNHKILRIYQVKQLYMSGVIKKKNWLQVMNSKVKKSKKLHLILKSQLKWVQLDLGTGKYGNYKKEVLNNYHNFKE